MWWHIFPLNQGFFQTQPRTVWTYSFLFHSFLNLCPKDTSDVSPTWDPSWWNTYLLLFTSRLCCWNPIISRNKSGMIRVCLKIGYISNNSHLIGIMISKTIGFRGTNHFQTNSTSFLLPSSCVQPAPPPPALHEARHPQRRPRWGNQFRGPWEFGAALDRVDKIWWDFSCKIGRSPAFNGSLNSWKNICIIRPSV